MEDLRNLSLQIMLWSAPVLILSSWGAFTLASHAKRVTAELELEDDGIGTGFAKSAHAAQVIFVFSTLALLILISGIIFGVGISGFILIFTIGAIRTGNPYVSVVFVAFGVILYGARTRFPFWYGIVEVIAGVSGIIYSIIIAGVASAPSNVTQLLLSVLGGMYVMVRGLDNMNKAIPEILKPAWRMIRWNVPIEAK
jgi:hypothetical protein